MNRHIATVHEGKMQEKEFKHTLCDNAAFTQKHNLKKHIESFHEGKKAFRCNICDLRFTQNGGLKIGKEKVVLNIHTSVVYPKETKDFKTEIVKENLLKMED